jgi:L-methionine (R)-S-oxide reductase
MTADKNKLLISLIKQTDAILKSKKDRTAKLKDICKLLKNQVPYYNFVGFYYANNMQNELLLGPFEGQTTEHVKIPFGKGICGQAAQQKKRFVIQDVSKETNYLSCSENVKAEIVVPIFWNNEIVGELDIDSHFNSPFTKEDELFLERICEKTAILFQTE